MDIIITFYVRNLIAFWFGAFSDPIRWFDSIFCIYVYVPCRGLTFSTYVFYMSSGRIDEI